MSVWEGESGKCECRVQVGAVALWEQTQKLPRNVDLTMKSKVRSKAIYRLVGAEQGNKLPYYERAGRKVFAAVVVLVHGPTVPIHGCWLFGL